MSNKYGGGGSRTPSGTPDTLLHKANKNSTETTQLLANADTYDLDQNADFEQKLTVHKHCLDTLLHKKCALCVPKNLPDDLKELINKWPELPENIKAAKAINGHAFFLAIITPLYSHSP